ncbi:MAG: tRNA (N6-threonylcarbamoyladenosine(37)-N6)-methyltransferase TrmO [Firmicutes bacterium]|nr:tRNA (N6-threonylcarbamoyladenosine(37)-N6)-methyltransferase TrmO [Bacillota bacterium]
MNLLPIGTIHSPYRVPADAPRQGRLSDLQVKLEIFPEYAEGLKDVERSSHLIVLYWFHLASRDVLQTRTPFGEEPRGVFACRSPSRPNPIAFCVADLLQREGNVLHVRGVEAIDGTPLIDVKPYSGKLDSIPEATTGWADRSVGK